MTEASRKDLCLYRLDRANECIVSAERMSEIDDYMTVANRSYYAMFHAVRAVMALDGEDRKKHSGVVAYFQEHYVKSGVFDKEFSYAIKNAFLVRQESDYEDFYVVSKAEALEQLENAKKFVAAVEKYISSLA